MLTGVENTPLESSVIDHLGHDPRIARSAEIAVGAAAGVVTLRGTVESFRQRHAAAEDARKTDGVSEVDDQLHVNLLGSDVRGDDEIRGIALQILLWDGDVPAENVNVKVSEGWLTLSGDVAYQFQSDAAYDDVSSLYGVVGVTNEIKVNTP